MRHLNGAKFGTAPDQFRAKTATVGVCSTFAFATETTIEELKTALKTKTLRKAVVENYKPAALCLSISTPK